jgi:hypothetical protein
MSGVEPATELVKAFPTCGELPITIRRLRELSELRVRRGGDRSSFPLWARSSFRNWNTPRAAA